MLNLRLRRGSDQHLSRRKGHARRKGTRGHYLQPALEVDRADHFRRAKVDAEHCTHELLADRDGRTDDLAMR
jgi:hypothetical protein